MVRVVVVGAGIAGLACVESRDEFAAGVAVHVSLSTDGCSDVLLRQAHKEQEESHEGKQSQDVLTHVHGKLSQDYPASLVAINSFRNFCMC